MSTGVVEFLHQAGERYKEHLEILKRQRRDEERRVGSGKPKVSPFANEWSEQTTRKSEAVEQRLFRLHERQLQKLNAARERSKKDAEAAEKSTMAKHLVLTEQGKHYHHRDPVAVTEKFLDDHDKKIKQLAEENVRRELAEMQTRPTVTALADTPRTAQRKQGLSIEEHLMRKEQERREKMFSVVERQNVPQGTFHPQITERARHVRTAAGHDVVARLYRGERETAPAFDEVFERDCTFQPFTNTRDFHYDDPCAHMPVFDRLHENLSRANVTVASSHSDEYNAELTFTPRISKTSQRIVNKKRAATKQASPTTRLYDEHHGKERESATTQSDTTPSFTPKTNSKSALIYQRMIRSVDDQQQSGTNKTPRELLWEKKEQERQRFLERLKADVAKREVAECSFCPNTSSAANTCVSGANPERFLAEEFSKRENLWVLHRDQSLHRLKEELEERELDGCTFQPEVHTEIPLVAAFVPNAAGFEAHLQRQQLARARRKEATGDDPAKRHHRVTARTTPTVPVPFLLGPQRAQQRRASSSEVDDVVSSLRPPISYREWESVRSTLVDDDDEGRNRSAGQSDTDEATTFVVRRPRQHRLVSPRRSPPRRGDGELRDPVDYIMHNHRAILRSIETR